MGAENVPITSSLARYAATLCYEDIPSTVTDRAKQLFLDFLGVAIGGQAFSESMTALNRAVDSLSGGAAGSATAIGRGKKYLSQYAALLNGAAAHSMDFDDTHMASCIHPGAPIFAALLAAAETRGGSGKDFLAAVVAAFDVALRIGNGHEDRIFLRGFHPTATSGVFGATCGVGKLARLSADELELTLGICLSQAAGSMQYLDNGAWTKRLQPGLAAQAAIVSVALSESGFVGATRALEGRYGYFNNYCEQYDVGKVLPGLGQDFEIMKTAIKPFPCCRSNHGVIDAVIAITSGASLKPKDIERIEVYLSPTSCQVVAQPEEHKRRPRNVVDAQFSVFFTGAVAALDRAFSWSSYQRLTDPEVLDFASRIRVRETTDIKTLQARVVIHAFDGHVFERTVLFPRGEPENPLSWEESVGKFRSLAGPLISSEEANRIVDIVVHLEEQAGCASLTRLLRPKEAEL